MPRSRCSTALLCVGLPAVAGLTFTGSVADEVNPFIAKFAFGSSTGGAIVGSAAIGYNTQQANTVLLAYDDTAWAGVYGSGLSCADAISVATQQLDLDVAHKSITVDFTESASPHYWYFTLINRDCSPVTMAWYSMTFTQANGSLLSYDQLGLPAIFSCFFALFLAGTLFHLYWHYLRHPRFGPLVVMLLSLSLLCMTLTTLCGIVEWGTVATSGVSSGGWLLAHYLFRVASVMCLWTMVALVACGYGVTTYNLCHRTNVLGLALLVVILVAYIAGLLFRVLEYDPADPNLDVTAWPMLFLAGVTVVYVCWFVYRVRRTIVKESRTDKRLVLWKIAVCLGAQFAVLPLTELTATLTPEYERKKIRDGMELFLAAATYAALLYSVWPKAAASAFRVYDGSHALLSEITEFDSDGNAISASISTAYSALEHQPVGVGAGLPSGSVALSFLHGEMEGDTGYYGGR